MSEDEWREHQARMRRDFGLRANPEWVAWVAKHGIDRGMTLGIPMTDSEFAEMRARQQHVHDATIDLVEHTLEELNHVVTLVHEARTTHPSFGRAMNSLGIEIKANVVTVAVLPDLDVTIPESLQPAVTAGTLAVEYADRRARLLGFA